MRRTSSVLVLGIAGGSGSGKSCLAARVAERLGPGGCTRLAHDDYYREFAGLAPAARAALDFDVPAALESDLLAEHLRALRRGEPVPVPEYDFARHARTGRVRVAEPAPVVVVEGILVLAEPDLRAALDLAVFVRAPESVRLARRTARDVRERGRTEDSVARQFAATVRPAHEAHVEPSAAHAHLVVDGEGDFDAAAETVLRALAALVNGSG